MVILSSMVLSANPSLSAGLALPCRLYALACGVESNDFGAAAAIFPQAGKISILLKIYQLIKK
ncbi:MAG: hypothetical protein H6901_01995 [Rhodobacteraceae bacterium]|nr:hypothetical protein [Paracoccaceae bacterium]